MNKKQLCVFIIVCIILVSGLILSESSEAFVDRCGVDIKSCSGERIRCINGYCKSDIAPTLPIFSDLEIILATKY